MSPEQAREILLLYRPGTADAEDPEIIEAMAVARRDPDLARWFERHLAFQSAMRSGFRQIEVPDQFKLELLAGRKIIRPVVWRQRPAWLAAAAAVVLVLGLAALWLKPAVPDRFANFQEMMVSKAENVAYAMDWTTNDMRALRQALAGRGAPADYEVPNGLARLQLTGGAALTWRANPVSMVCFDRGDKQMVFLFVMKRAALKDPPPAKPLIGRIDALTTVSWTTGDRTYLLAGPQEADFLQKYL
ncbi:MAG TPA: hypothetical protein VNZ64_03280 [Candidatus Acidoferrum sp.]|nr:hypothetical protein [Candidatus Acidoferrum sp.]